MPRILFVGNFLSRKRGTKGIAERIAERHAEFENLSLIMASYFENKILRLLDIMWKGAIAEYDVMVIDVYSGTYFFVVRIATRIAVLRQKKVILNLHGGKLYELEHQIPIVFKRTMKRASVLITPSLFLKDKLGKPGYDISYLPNFIDIERFPYAQRTQSNALLWVRAFVSIYNPTMALQVLAEVRKEIPSATLTMIGPDHGQLSECIEIIEQLDLSEAVIIKGQIENSELIHYYHRHGVFLNTTDYESFGLAVLEAASAGIPVVSNRVGEIPYLWKEGEEMLMCDRGDVYQMTKHVVSLLQDDSQAKILSYAARQRAEQFSWEKIKTQWLSLMKVYG